MDDLISRQAAIDAVQQHREGVLGGYEYDEGVAFVYAAAHNHIIDVIKKLPSAQPEIVRCRDCKWYEISRLKKDGTDDRRYKPDLCVLHNRNFQDDYFCADGERREDAD